MIQTTEDLNKLRELMGIVMEAYTHCEDCRCRADGCNCPTQSYLDDKIEELQNKYGDVVKSE